MNSGYYVGNGTSQSITGLGFQPDLVIIKSEVANYGVGTTAQMHDPESTAYFTQNSDNFDNGVEVASGGFSVGSNGNVNNAGTVYCWTAFGNSGSADFKIGTYTGNGQAAERYVTGLGFQPDCVVIKREGTSRAVWHTSAMAVDTVSYFSSTADDATGQIKSFDTDGFKIGTANAGVNDYADTYFYFAFKQESDKFKVGTYTGDGADDPPA
ncbi:MAG: hypothetical protein U9R38_05405 [Candidatus Margulisiibacteriota bacterium]|nr:hypothetical protein [Candidatus Margulisiibacteriota bacterium]